MDAKARDLTRDFVVLSPSKEATIETANDDLYARLDRTYGGFAGHELISSHCFDSDWGSWECHPAGDEIVVLLSGAAIFELEMSDGVKRIELKAQGDYVVVPRGIWHTARIADAACMLFVTPGEGTQHREDSPV